MNVVNKVLSCFGLRLSRTRANTTLPDRFKEEYEKNFVLCRSNRRGFDVVRQPMFDTGEHPVSYMDFECAFAARQLADKLPNAILDVGSYRQFILGLLASHQVTTVDVRDRPAASPRERVLTCDATRLSLPDDSFDAVVSLCAIEHFGLGRYGDSFDLDADRKAMGEMIRVLKSRGVLVFTTAVTQAKPVIAFNAHRIYGMEMIRELCRGLREKESRFYSHALGRYCAEDQITSEPATWDVYCGCWQKP
jgi:SAM-dependent methyltransferase